ncbi:hypothetical protein [Kribbella sp. NPDC051620]|uniref:hypothetical protein n=1 Tax=Kribbella sp. NPDC051620 TaxID=3364120 RepID=UPI0037B7617D
MPGELSGITESMLHLGNNTRSNMADMLSTKQALKGHMESARPGFMGQGGDASQITHEDWDIMDTNRVHLPGLDVADQVTNIANGYDQADLDIKGLVGSLGQAINPSA